MTQLCKAGGRRGADPLTRTVLPDKVGKSWCDRQTPLAQRVIVRVRDLRRVLLIVERIMPGYLLGQPGQFPGGLRRLQLFDRLFVRLHAFAISRSAAARASSVT